MTIRSSWKAAALATATTIMITTGAASVAQNLGEVRVFTPGPAVTMLPMHVAMVKGFDKEAGFTTTLTQTAGAIGVKAMIGGDFEFGMSAGSSLTAAVNGAPVRIIYAHVAKSLFYFYAQEALTNMKALEGKRIAVDAIGGSQDIAARLAMRAGGANPASAIFLGMGFKAIPGALIAGAIDAAVITPPTDLQLINSSKKFEYLGFLGDHQSSLTGGLATTEAMIKRRPELVRAVVNAHYKAHQFILANRDETVPIMAKYLGLSEADARLTYDKLIGHFTKSGTIPLDAQKTMIEDQVRALNAKRSPAPEEIFVFRFVNEAK